MDKNILKFRIFLWLILTVIIGWFVYFKIVPSGRVSYLIQAGRPNYFVGKLTPAERVELNGGLVLIKGDPVYFSLRPPRRFTQAKVTVKFKNTTDFPVLAMGLLNDKVAWNYELRPMQNKIIDRLALVWPEVRGQDGSRLIEREKKYDSVESFLKNPPARNEIALYDYDLNVEFKLSDYRPGKARRVIDYGFRGPYQFYTYVKNENLNYLFDFTDLNVNADDDPVEIRVYSPAGLIYNKRLEDGAVAERQADLRLANLPEGVYRLSVIANDDIVTERIVTSQSLFSLINKVWLAGGGKIPVLYTDSREVSAQTINPASLGEIKAGDGLIKLAETYRQYSVLTGKRPAAVELDKTDVIISGDGVFSFNRDGLLNPRFSDIDRNLDINQEKINYLVTAYQPPVQADDWLMAVAVFDLTKAYRENGKYQFIISSPGLKAEDETAGELLIKEIKVELEGTSLREKIKKYFQP